MRLSLETPLGLLAATAALVPLVALLVRERRSARLRDALGLPPPGRRRLVLAASALGACFVLLGLAAARPVVRVRSPERVRTDAGVFVVLDVSRSMLASSRPAAPTRYARALSFARRLRAQLPEVPFGVASLTDRALPHLFPTADAVAYGSVLERALGIERPPPSMQSWNATDFGALTHIPTDNFFPPAERKRLVVVVSDGESVRFSAASLVSVYREQHVGLVLVRVGAASDRIFDARGRDIGFRPAREALASSDRTAALLGTRVYSDAEVGPLAARVKALLGRGPTAPAGTRERAVELGRPLVLAAALLLALLFVVRYRPVGRTKSPAAALSPIARSSPFSRTVS